MKDVSIIIPAYNAAHCIESTCVKVASYFANSPEDYEVIIVDDGSCDSTARIIFKILARDKRIKHLKNEKNSGKGHAVRKGMLASGGEIKLFMDADSSTDISYLSKARVKLDKGFDIVIASRSKKDAPGAFQASPQSPLRRISGSLGNLIIRMAGLKGIYDTQCGFKLFTKNAADRLFHLSRTNRWAIDVEILFLARRYDFKIGIIPVRWYNDSKTTVKPLSYLQMLKELASIKYNTITGAYNI